MKFLFGVWGLTNGGAERVLAVFCNTLAEKGHEVHLYIRFHEKQEYCISPKVHVHRAFDLSIEELDEINHKTGASQDLKHKIIKRIKIIKKVPVIGDYIESLRLFVTGKDKKEMIAKMIDEIKPDLIIPFLLGAQIEFYHALLSSDYKAPYVFTVRSYQDKYDKAEQRIQRFLEKKADYIWCQTKDQIEYYDSELRKKAFVVGNPINELFISAQIKPVSQIKRFIAAGRLTNQKNYRLMIEGFKEAAGNDENFSLDIYGNGELKEDLEKLIHDIGAEKQIRIHRRTDDILSKYQEADAFLMTSDFEGMPNALMEAMCLGLPCISTDCPTGPRDLIGDNERGYLVPCRNRKKLVKTIQELTRECDDAAERAGKAAEYIRSNFNRDVICDAFIRECERICRKGISSEKDL